MGNQVSTRKKKTSSEKKNKTASVSSAVRTFTDSFNNGSTVSSNQPKFTAEVFPSTTLEANRQQGEHYLLKHVFQTSYFAPIDDILSKPDTACLDIGCGPHASWLIDIANDFPSCTFHGFDIIQPFALNEDDADITFHIPSNCEFKKQDLFDGFGYPDSTFDYTHQRTMHLIYHSDKVSWMFTELMRVTKENGWIELVEPDVMPKRAGPIFGKMMVGIRAFLKDKLGNSFLQANALCKRMEDAGMVDIKSDYGSVPVCWGGYVGKLVYEDMLLMFQHLGPIMYEYLDFEGEFNKEVYDALIDSAFDECVEFQTFFNVRWAYGRKPSTTTTATSTMAAPTYVQ
ncbi:type 11 methyltransferase [Mucor ambiguus]|uniref:Type 11 methyltransferase n=1 Tax=Mucor ambiguus TaxID=91626 RepID=A0A0C9M1G7_9FUNG|nr:type 11 methyltransferase [Mucor ambiguus]